MPDLHPHHEDHPTMVSRNARRGLFLFCVYLAVFIIYLMINVFSPETMAKPSLGGPNVAVVFGIGLIFMAFGLALVYMVMTRKPSD